MNFQDYQLLTLDQIEAKIEEQVNNESLYVLTLGKEEAIRQATTELRDYNPQLDFREFVLVCSIINKVITNFFKP